MKNYLLILPILLYSYCCFSHRMTTVTVNIPQVDITTLSARIYVEDPTKTIGSERFLDTLEIKNGTCQFSFEINRASRMALWVNNKFLTFPGEYMVLIEPSDSLVFNLPSILEAGYFGFGISKIKISGKGSDKVNLTKDIITEYFKIFATDTEYQKQSLAYNFQTTDRKLNVVDSIYRSNKVVPEKIKDLIKAQLYSSLLVSVFRHSKRSESDSVRALFQKYIVEKKRMDIFYKKDIFYYHSIIPSYLILSEFENPVVVGGDDYQTNHRLQYAEILVKRLNKFPQIRDYLLSSHVINTIRSGFDSTTVKLYEYYCNSADFNNPNYTTVVNLYESTEKKFAAGKPFYNFSLPDSTGKIYRLSDFIDKVLVIDFWYNGCGGCRLMVPALEKIEKALEEKDVQFISIGIDKKDLWLEGIGKYSSIGSLQLYTSEKGKYHPMMQYLNVYAYPRLIIVDKNGKIAAAPADPRTNEDDFIKQIESLL